MKGPGKEEVVMPLGAVLTAKRAQRNRNGSTIISSKPGAGATGARPDYCKPGSTSTNKI